VDEIAENVIEKGTLLYIMIKTASIHGDIVGQVLLWWKMPPDNASIC
jgi:hypothetical protein